MVSLLCIVQILTIFCFGLLFSILRQFSTELQPLITDNKNGFRLISWERFDGFRWKFIYQLMLTISNLGLLLCIFRQFSTELQPVPKQNSFRSISWERINGFGRNFIYQMILTTLLLRLLLGKACLFSIELSKLSPLNDKQETRRMVMSRWCSRNRAKDTD